MRAIVVAVLCCFSFAFGAGMMSLATTMQSKHHAAAPDDLIFAGTCDDTLAHCSPAPYKPTGPEPPPLLPTPSPCKKHGVYPSSVVIRGATINITDVQDSRIAIMDPSRDASGAVSGHVKVLLGICLTVNRKPEFVTQILDVPYESTDQLKVETWRK